MPNISYTAYYPTGLVKATWGSQIYPTWNVYDEQNRMTQLHTWKSAPALDPATIPANPPAGSEVTAWIYGGATGRLDRKQYADTKGTDYTYTAAGRLRTRVWARGITTTTYNYTHGFLTFTDYSDATPDVATQYDALGRPATVIQANQSQIVYAYNPANLALDTETIRYDLDHDGTYEFTRVLDRSDDALGRDTGFDLKNGTALENRAEYRYSATDGRLAKVLGLATSSLPYLEFAYGYTPNSDLLATVTGPIHTVTNTWEPNRDVLDIMENKVGNSVISKYHYGSAEIGQRTNIACAGSAIPTPDHPAQIHSWTWEYNSLSQLTKSNYASGASYIAMFGVQTSSRSYEYDAIGNRKKSYNSDSYLPPNDTYATDPANRYTSVTLGGNTNPQTFVPSYDNDGNMVSGPVPGTNVLAPSSADFAWDAENRLRTVTVSGGGGGTFSSSAAIYNKSLNTANVASPLPTVTYLYDAYSRRIGKMTGSNTILYIYDGWNCIAEYESSVGAPPLLKKTRLWGLDFSNTLQGAGGVGGLLSETINNQPSTLNYYSTYDGNGNVSEYLASNGTVTAHFEYDPFGNTIVNTGASNQFAYRFSTKPLDFASGLYYYGYRYYDPLTGRWPSRDPIEERGGLNLYGFVGNNGVNGMDYLGLFDTVEEAIRAGYADAVEKSNADHKKDVFASNISGDNRYWDREWGGIICKKCDAKTENDQYLNSKSHPGYWTGPKQLPDKSFTTSKYKEKGKGEVIIDGKTKGSGGGEVDPQVTMEDEAVDCAKEFGEGWEFAGTFHSHPPAMPAGGGSPSDQDYNSGDNPNAGRGKPWGVGWSDKGGVINGVIVHPNGKGSSDRATPAIQIPIPLPNVPHPSTPQ